MNFNLINSNTFSNNGDTDNRETDNRETDNRETDNRETDNGETIVNVSTNIFANIKKYQHEEYQYLNLIRKILDEGIWTKGRNGNTKSIFGCSMRFSLQNGKIPILTTKKTAWKTCLKELIWFIRGQTNNKILKEQGVHIWDANGTREFLDSRGLTYYELDELGPIYGRQWRSFNKSYFCQAYEQELRKTYEYLILINGNDNGSLQDYFKKLEEKGVDQLQEIIDQLKNPETRNSRRLIMTAWNPCQLNQMALPPCHILCQFNVHDDNKLSCAMYQRSNDELLGTPFNIASYSFLTHLLAKHCGLEAYEFVYFKGNCHIYEEHIEGAKLQIEREPYEFPTLIIKNIKSNIDDYEVDDFEIQCYKHHESIKFDIIA